MDSGGAFDGIANEFVYRGDDPLGIELPVDEEAVSRQSAVKRAGGDPVEIGNEAASDGPKPIEIEMSVASFQGIESPLDVSNASMEGFVALKKF